MFDVIKVCPYCGNSYGARIGCCGEHDGHGVYIITDDPDEDAVYIYKEEAEAEADALFLDYQRSKYNATPG